MQGNTISVDRVIGASASAIFTLLCDPSTHSRFDGSATVNPALAAHRLSLGSTFVMAMRGRRETLFFPYRTTNTVIEFEPDRRIACKTTAIGLVGGRIWRYELNPADGDSTFVRETWDISQDRQQSFLKRTSAPALTQQAIRSTLEHIAVLLKPARVDPRTGNPLSPNTSRTLLFTVLSSRVRTITTDNPPYPTWTYSPGVTAFRGVRRIALRSRRAHLADVAGE